jgi:hypothetical protein
MTSNEISSGQTVLYEGAFVAEGVLCAVDIMVNSEDGWNIYEVKSTTKTKKQHKVDCALQYWVLTKCGIKIASMNLMHLNPAFVKLEDDIDVNSLFEWDNVTKDVLKLQSFVDTQVATQTNIIDIEDCIPDVKVGAHCVTPYKCDFYSHCWASMDLPAYSILNLSYGYGKQWELLEMGIKTVRDIPDAFPLDNLSQQVQVACEKTGAVRVVYDELSKFLNTLVYPLYFLDFETVMSAVPVFRNTRCFQQLCFQYSLHIQPVSEQQTSGTLLADRMLSDGLITHREHLAVGTGADPRPALIEQLISDMGETGSVVVYNQSFEESRLREMALDFPQYANALHAIMSRLVDLAVPFQQKHYYCREMQGKYSIKNVLPALVPAMREAYSSMPIHEGQTASNTFLALMSGSFEGDVEQVRDDLCRYCELDTWAMVKVLEKLYCVVAEKQQHQSSDACVEELQEALQRSFHIGDGGPTKSEVRDAMKTAAATTTTAAISVDDVAVTEVESHVFEEMKTSNAAGLSSNDDDAASDTTASTTTTSIVINSEGDAHSCSGNTKLVKCISEGGRLRVKVISPGYDPEKNCQFPTFLREDGKVFMVDEIEDAGSFYRVKGSIAPHILLNSEEDIHSCDGNLIPTDGRPALVQCVTEGGRLRVKVISPGYDPEKNCQFPTFLREDGKVFMVDEIKDAGSFYRVKGSIVPQQL